MHFILGRIKAEIKTVKKTENIDNPFLQKKINGIFLAV